MSSIATTAPTSVYRTSRSNSIATATFSATATTSASVHCPTSHITTTTPATSPCYRRTRNGRNNSDPASATLCDHSTRAHSPRATTAGTA